MKNIFIKIKNQKGYALLFTMIVVTSISLITAGLSSAITKQLTLSLLAKHSQVAFSQADTGAECGLYADRKLSPGFDFNDVVSFDCGGVGLIGQGNSVKYILSPDMWESIDTPCFKIEVEKDIINSTTTLISKGYNICNTSNSSSVERAIEINY